MPTCETSKPSLRGTAAVRRETSGMAVRVGFNQNEDAMRQTSRRQYLVVFDQLLDEKLAQISSAAKNEHSLLGGLHSAGVNCYFEARGRPVLVLSAHMEAE